MALCLTPVILVSAVLQAKYDPNKPQFNTSEAQDEEREEKNESDDVLVGDCVMNYKTVAGFATDEVILSEFKAFLDEKFKNAARKAKIHGFAFGFSQFGTNFFFAGLFYAAAYLIKNHSNPFESNFINPQNIFIAQFTILFGAFSAGQASQFGPDAVKAKAAGVKIFSIMEEPTDINAVDDDENLKPEEAEFQGQIEFRDVWFRYPTRPNEWVFKGLNLLIKPNDCIAVVGESGQGKSTMINLIMRFYDPDHGQVLIDGKDAKEYSVAFLRAKMGLVM